MPNVPVPGMPLTGSGYVAPAPGSAPAGRPKSNHMRDHQFVDQDRLHKKSRHLFTH